MTAIPPEFVSLVRVQRAFGPALPDVPRCPTLVAWGNAMQPLCRSFHRGSGRVLREGFPDAMALSCQSVPPEPAPDPEARRPAPSPQRTLEDR